MAEAVRDPRPGPDRHNAQTMALTFTDGTARRKRAQFGAGSSGGRGVHSTKAATTTTGIASLFEVTTALVPMSGYESVEAQNLGAYLGQRASTDSARDPGGTRIVTEPQGGPAQPCRSRARLRQRTQTADHPE